MDALETQLLLNRAAVKSPGFAAILAFFFPWAGAFYNGKIAAGIVFLVIDGVFLLLSLLGIGLVLRFFYMLLAAFQSYKWAAAANQRELERLIQMQRQAGAVQA